MAGFPMPGQKIGPYLVVREIGRGPTGVVLEGALLEAGATAAPPGSERVALKVRTPATSLAEGLRTRYGADLDALAATRSPRLLPVVRVGVHDDRFLTVTPYVAGGDVAARLAFGPLDPTTTLEWATALAEGLAAVHGAGLVHGGVRAQNLLLPAPGAAPVLTDVGASLLDQEWLRPPGVATVVPPVPEGGPPTVAGDVWAAGWLIQSLAGSAPGPALAAVIRRATDPDPSRRYADGDALARALLLVPAVDVDTGPAVHELASRRRRRAALLAVGGLAAVAVAGGAVALLGHRGAPPAARAEVVVPSPTASSAPVVDTAPPDRPRVSGAAGYRSVVFSVRAPAGASRGVRLQVDRGSGWEDVATRTVTVSTTAGGEQACLRARSVLGGRNSTPTRACARSEAPELTTVRHPDCLIDGLYRQVCYTLVARGFAPEQDDELVFSVDGRPMGTATVHIGRDGTGTLPGGQHFHFADSDAGATARIVMAGITHTWQVDRRS